MRRRFFKRFEKRIEGCRGKHVNFVDDIDFVFALRWREVDLVAQVAEIVHAGISVVGLEVPHAHIHLIPINSANDLNFTQAKQQASAESLKKVQEKIVAAL